MSWLYVGGAALLCAILYETVPSVGTWFVVLVVLAMITQAAGKGIV